MQASDTTSQVRSPDAKAPRELAEPTTRSVSAPDTAGNGKGSPAFDLSAKEEARLCRRLRIWARTELGLRADDFGDMYQAAWRALLELQHRAPTYGSLELALRWALQCRWRNELRRRQRRPSISLDALEEDALLSVGEDPAAQVERRQDARHILEAVGTLSERQRQILLLADIWELRPGEVIARLGLSPRTYRREHARALAAVTAHVTDLLDGDWWQPHRPMLTLYRSSRQRAPGFDEINEPEEGTTHGITASPPAI